jgi:release factor glutamine methyltransferase
VLIPRPETELLARQVIEEVEEPQDGLNILDIGTGSGCIAIALAKHFSNSNVLAIDVSEGALATAKRNAEQNGVKNVYFKRIDILRDDLSGNNGIYAKNSDDHSGNSENYSGNEFDIIVSNPPYISAMEYETLEPELKLFEPKLALSDSSDGLDFYRRFAKIFKFLLATSGRAYLEVGFGQGGQVLELFNEYGNARLIEDYSKIERILSVEKI